MSWKSNSKKFGELSFEYLKQQLSRNSIAFVIVNTFGNLSNHFAIKRQWVRTSFDQKVSFPEGPLKEILQRALLFKRVLGHQLSENIHSL